MVSVVILLSLSSSRFNGVFSLLSWVVAMYYFQMHVLFLVL